MSSPSTPLIGAKGPIAAPKTGCGMQGEFACETGGWRGPRRLDHSQSCGLRRPCLARRAFLLGLHVSPLAWRPTLPIRRAQHKVRPFDYDPRTPRSSFDHRAPTGIAFPDAAKPRAQVYERPPSDRPIRFRPIDHPDGKALCQSPLELGYRRLCWSICPVSSCAPNELRYPKSVSLLKSSESFSFLNVIGQKCPKQIFNM